ncbi:hypothetical protein D3C76_649010 [compost metagenome]
MNDRPRQQRHVVCRRVVLRVRQTRGIHEMAVGHAQVFGRLVHQVGECIFAAGNMLGDRDAGVVAGLDDDAVQQIVEADLGADLDEHARTTGTPGVFADRYRIVLTDLAATDFQGRDVGRHQLGQAGWGQTLVAVVLDQDVAARSFHEHVGLGSELRRGRHHLLCRPSGRGDHERNQQAQAFGKGGDVHPSLEIANGLTALAGKTCFGPRGPVGKTAIVQAVLQLVVSRLSRRSAGPDWPGVRCPPLSALRPGCSSAPGEPGAGFAGYARSS